MPKLRRTDRCCARDEDAGAPSLDVEIGHVTLTWAGRFVSSTGATYSVTFALSEP